MEREGGRGKGTKKECREEREREKSDRVEIVNSILVTTETSLSCSIISTSEFCQENLTLPVSMAIYVCRYHGPPLKQLKQLSSQGTYRTRQAAVAEGRPSDSICWPVEANISLPTPHHTSPLALIASSHKAQTTSSLLQGQSFVIPNKVEDLRLLPQQGKEENKPGECMSREGGEQRERGRVVYDCSNSKGSSTEEMIEEDGGLIFESRFEGGNLHMARQM